MPSPQADHRILVVDDDPELCGALAELLSAAGHQAVHVADGAAALRCLETCEIAVVLLDLAVPGVDGLGVLARAREKAPPPAVVVMTADDTSETLLKAVRQQAFRYVRKPVAAQALAEVIAEAVAAADAAALPIDVISASPAWLELEAPCSLVVAERIQSFVLQLELPDKVRESVGQAFRELLNNAVEWGGKLDPTRKVRISCIRTGRLLIYRIADPGEGFDLGGLRHAAVNNPDGDPLQHAFVRQEMGLRPGGLGLLIARSLVDELIFNEARNEVLFIKYLD